MQSVFIEKQKQIELGCIIQQESKFNNFVIKTVPMRREIIVIAIIALGGVSTNAFSQEIGLATFQETAQIMINEKEPQSITASVTLQSTSIQEIKIPSELEQKIRENENISSIVITNHEKCILGVTNESCILINVKRDFRDTNFPAIQNSTLKVSEQFIEDINNLFDTNAELHSTFVHPNDEANTTLQTSGAISGRGTISAVYTMPMEDTYSMYEKISSMLIPKIIRDSGGFYDVARNLSTDENAKMAFSIIPSENKSLLQLRLSTEYPEPELNTEKISPLQFLKTEELKRSAYFSQGTYPLNSIIQIVVLSPEETNVSDVRGNIVSTKIVDDEKIPTDLTNHGWVFDPDEGQVIQGKYIFGEKQAVTGEELEFSTGGDSIQIKKQESDESIAVIVIITTVAIAAALFYLKGYKK